METIAVFIAGMLGGLARLGITNIINYQFFPIATLLINLIGALLLPLWTDYICDKLKFTKKVNRIVGTGFIGSFTTFSGMILDGFKLLQAQQILFLVIYLGVSLLGGVFLALIGDNLGNFLSNREELKQ